MTTLIKRMGFVVASLLWGVMSFLTYKNYLCGKPLNPYQDKKTILLSVLKYDTFFILAFTIFSIGYIFELRKNLIKNQLKNQESNRYNGLYILLFFTLVYATVDFTENYLLKCSLSDPLYSNVDPRWLSIAKWPLAFLPIFIGCFLEIFRLENWKNVIKGLLYSLLYITITITVLALFYCKIR